MDGNNKYLNDVARRPTHNTVTVYIYDDDDYRISCWKSTCIYIHTIMIVNINQLRNIKVDSFDILYKEQSFCSVKQQQQLCHRDL